MFGYSQPLPSISPLWPIGARSAFYVGQPAYLCDVGTFTFPVAAAPQTVTAH